MAILRIRTYPDPVLKEACAPVKAVNDKIRMLLQDMAETMYASNGVGLAAPQVGETCRVIVVDVRNLGEGGGLLKLINPEITSREGKRKSEEGCLSLPDFTLEVDRCEKITVEALNPDGLRHRIEAEGLLSVALQHEIDHLDGALLVDRLSTLRRKLYCRKRMREEAAVAY